MGNPLKPFLYQTPGESENSEQLNLIETASQPKDEFSLAKADALIINKASAFNSIPSAQTSAPKTNSYSRDAKISEIDPLIGKLDSDLGDPLTNPNRIISPVVTASTTSEKAAPKTPLPASAETSSKPEGQKTSLSPTDKLELNKTVPSYHSFRQDRLSQAISKLHNCRESQLRRTISYCRSFQQNRLR